MAVAPLLVKDYYIILGVARNANREEIKTAFRRLSLQYHPNRNQSQESREVFMEVREAYGVLYDDQQRALYDLQLLALQWIVQEQQIACVEAQLWKKEEKRIVNSIVCRTCIIVTSILGLIVTAIIVFS